MLLVGVYVHSLITEFVPNHHGDGGVGCLSIAVFVTTGSSVRLTLRGICAGRCNMLTHELKSLPGWQAANTVCQASKGLGFRVQALGCHGGSS